jgi:K+-sensing histidine kinase KdpD
VLITHPNRDKPAVRGTRAVVVLLLLASAAVLALITIAGWNVLEGAVPVDVLYILFYLGLAWLAMRWNRGSLPVSAALAVFLLIFAAVAAPGWFEREKAGYAKPLLNSDLLGLLTVLVIPLQLTLVAFAMRGVGQGWNVEVEQRIDHIPASAVVL